MRFPWMLALPLALAISCNGDPSPDPGIAGGTPTAPSPTSAEAEFPAFGTLEGTRWSGPYALRGNPPCEGVVEGVVEMVLGVEGKHSLPLSLQARTDAVGAALSGAARLNAVMEVQDDGTCWVIPGIHEYRFDGELGSLSPSGSMDLTLSLLYQVDVPEVLFMPSGTLQADGDITGDLFTGSHAAYAWLDLEPVSPELAAAATITPAPTPALTLSQSPPAAVTPNLVDLRTQMAGVTFEGFPRPQALAFDGEHIWIAHSAENTVTKLRQDGQVMATVSVGDGPRTILYAAEYIWVGNGRDGTVTKVDPSGQVVDTYAIGGGGTAPVDLAYDGELLWVVTSWGNAVYSMTVDGEVVNRIPIRGTHPSPWAIALEGKHLWVASLNLREVQKFNREGTLVARYRVSDAPPPASGFEELPFGAMGLGGKGPSGLAFDGESIWVSINWEGKLIQLSLEGEVLTQIVVGGWPGHLVFDGRYLWTAAWGGAMVLRVDVATGKTGFFPVDSPSAVVSAGDDLWVTSLWGNNLLKLVPVPSSTETE